MFPHLRAVATGCLTLLLAASLAAQADVIVIDEAGGPGSDFTELPAAIDAAQPGDLLLLRDGVYFGPGDTINGKPLSVVADEGASVRVDSWFVIRNLAADEACFLSGLELRSAAGLSSVLSPILNVGPIWVDRCDIDGLRGLRSFQLAVTDSVISSDQPRTGIDMFESNLVVYGTNVQAGKGANGYDDAKLQVAMPGETGISAVEITGESRVVLIDGDFHAGDGGDGAEPFVHPCSDGGAGGAGLALFSTEASVYLQGATFSAGQPGPGGTGGCSAGGPGAPMIVNPGASRPVTLAGTPRALHSDKRVAREGESVTLDFVGEPGDRAFLLYGFEQGHSFEPKFKGSLLQRNFFIFPPPLSLSPAGELQLSFVVPELGPGAESLNLYLTPFFVDASLGRFLGAPTAVVLLDERF